MGTEKDVGLLKQHGKPGDFVLYEKNQGLRGNDSGFRIAFIKHDKETNFESSLRKVRILKTEDRNKGRPGFCLEHEPNKWSDTLDTLLSTWRKDPHLGIDTPFDGSIQQTKTTLSPSTNLPSVQRKRSLSSPNTLARFSQKDKAKPSRALSPNNMLSNRSNSQSLISLDDPNIDHVFYNEPNVKTLLEGKPEGNKCSPQIVNLYFLLFKDHSFVTCMSCI